MAINANTQIYDKAIDRAAMIRLYERKLNNKVELVINGHTVRVDKLIREASLTPAGFNRLRDAVDKELQKTYKEAYNISKRGLLDLAADQLSYVYQNIETAMGNIWKTERPQRRIAEEIVLEKPLLENRTLAAGWSGVSLNEKMRIEAAIRKGMAEGKSVDQIALTIRKGNIHNITRMQSRALVVTAMTSVHAQVDHAVYKANEKALQGWQYVAVLDARTTPLCAHRDGQIYPIDDREHLPPAHFNCRSTTIPVFKSWNDIGSLEGVAQVRKRNISKLTKQQIAFYDGQTPLRETYNDWLLRQPKDVQARHLGDYQKADLLNSGKLTVNQFTNANGEGIGIKQLRRMTDSTYDVEGDTIKFANAKAKLDMMKLWATNPDDFINNKELAQTLKDYYLLQTKDLNGVLSYTNYRGSLLHIKKATRNRVLNSPPREDQLIFNPATGRYEDVRLYQPNPYVLNNNLRLVEESKDLLDRDKEFIKNINDDLSEYMSINERAAVVDNLRITFGRQRINKDVWTNFKAVSNSQMKFDVMNVSDTIETQLRKDQDLLKRLKQANYIDPVLGTTQLDDLSINFLSNIRARNNWEDKVAPKIAKELRTIFDPTLPVKIRSRLSEDDLHQFYLKFAHRLSLADSPDRDQFAVALGRDLYNLANLNGWRRQWYDLGMKILNSKNVSKFFEVETFGVQKRRMKSRMSGQYFGPYYDTMAYNIRVVDPRIQEYARLQRKVDIGLRVSVTDDKNRLVFREGYKTYHIDNGILGLEDTRIPITSTSSFSDFPEEFVDKNMVDALTWASKSKYRIDEDFYDFVDKLLYFKDDKGKAAYYDGLNEYKHYISARGDAYERFKAMDWLRASGKAFSNHPFIDHRARVYDRGLIGPQSGESFRPFLNTEIEKNFSPDDFFNFQDQIGSFLGGLSDEFEGNFNSLSNTGRQKVAQKWRKDLVDIGNLMLSRKPNDIRKILEHPTVHMVEGEELGKFFRFAIETAKIDNYLKKTAGNFPDRGELFHISTVPLTNTKFTPRIPSNFLTEQGFEDNTIKRISFAGDIDSALKAMSMNLKGKKLYVYKAPSDTKFTIPTKAQVPDVDITNEKWVTEPVEVELLGEIQVGTAIEKPFKYTYGNNEAELYGWNWKKITSVDPYSSQNLEKLRNYKTALALEQDASSSGAQIIALTTRNKQLAELSNVVPTTQKRRLYDEIAAATYNDPRFKIINEKLGLNEKDLRKAAKAQNMVTFYGAGERTGVMNVEGKLAKVLGKQGNTLVVSAGDRDKVLEEISARAARYEKFDPETAMELKELRENVKDIFNKGLDPGDDILEQLYFLEPKTYDLVEKLSHDYNMVVTPGDFKAIAKIMSEHLREQVPILKDFTRFFGRLAEDYLNNAKPSNAAFDWKTIVKQQILGSEKKGYVLPDTLSRILGLKAGEALSEKALKRLRFYKPDSNLHDMIYGVKGPKARATGGKYFKLSVVVPKIPTVSSLLKGEYFKENKIFEVELLSANKLPKSWTNVPWVNFDGKVIEQNFTQQFEERLTYKNKQGEWTTNILQVPQKTELTWWEEMMNKDGKINDIANATKARTAFAVNG